MGIRHGAAKAAGAVSTWGLKHVFRRPAANFPGKIGLYADPQLIAHERGKLSRGSIVVVGTNGKTTVTNLLADVLERSGATVVCNRTGANLDSGIATALLHAGRADWGVLESDELWLAKSLPQLQARYVVLLNLFRDQLDRCGEIDRIQDAIVGALEGSRRKRARLQRRRPLVRRHRRPGAQPLRVLRRGPLPWGLPRTACPTPPCASDAPPCSATSFASTGSWGSTCARTAGSPGPALDYAAVDGRFGCRGAVVFRGRARARRLLGQRSRRFVLARRFPGPTWCTTCWPWPLRPTLRGRRRPTCSAPSTPSIRRTAVCRSLPWEAAACC